MKHLLSILLISISLLAQAQVTLNVYPSGDRIYVNSPDGKTPYPAGALTFTSKNNAIKIMSGATTIFNCTPAQFLDKNNAQWGATADLAVDNIVTAAKSTAGTITPATFGTTAPTNYTANTNQSVTTTNAIYILVENLSTNSGSASCTYGNVTYSMLPGEGREFKAFLDESSTKYVPIIPSLSLIPNGQVMAVTIIPKQ
ncbi:hypothetical protein GCM10028805_22400 [Spirosoma harenae]